jgi:hypothetical protein
MAEIKIQANHRLKWYGSPIPAVEVAVVRFLFGQRHHGDGRKSRSKTAGGKKNCPGMVRDLGVSQVMGAPQVTIGFNTKMV